MQNKFILTGAAIPPMSKDMGFLAEKRLMKQIDLGKDLGRDLSRFSLFRPAVSDLYNSIDLTINRIVEINVGVPIYNFLDPINRSIFYFMVKELDLRIVSRNLISHA